MITVKEQEKLLDLTRKYGHAYMEYECALFLERYCSVDERNEANQKQIKTEDEMIEYIRSLTFTAQIGE